jgi:hypothetical protein
MTLKELSEKINIQGDIYTLSPCVLSPDVDQWLKKYFPDNHLQINNAKKSENSTYIVISGNTNIKKDNFCLENENIELMFSIDEKDNICIVLKVILSEGWSFDKIFPKIYGGTNNTLSNIEYSECYLLITNQFIEKYQFTEKTNCTLYEGINFYGVISNSPLMAHLEKKFSIYPIMHGHIKLDDTSILDPLSWEEFPFNKDSIENPLPGFVFEIELKDYNNFKFTEIVEFNNLSLRIYCPPDQDFVQNNISYTPCQVFYGNANVPSLNNDEIECWINYIPSMLAFEVFFNFKDNNSLNSLEKISKLCGDNKITESLPSALNNTQLGKLKITNLNINFNLLNKMPSLDGVMINISMGDAKWSILNNSIQIDKIRSTFSYTTDEFSENKFRVRISGEVKIWGIDWDVSASNENGFTLYLNKKINPAIHLGKFLTDNLKIKNIPTIPDLTIDSFQSEISPKSHIEIMTVMAANGNVWKIPVGITSIKLSDMLLYIHYDFGNESSYQGYIAGTLAIDALKVRATCALPAKDISIQAQLPDFDLRKLTEKFCDTSIPWPGNFNIQLTDSVVLFEKNNTDYLLKLATLVNNSCFLVFQIKKTANNTGFILGLNIDGSELTNQLEGWGLTILKKLLDILKLDKLVLVISTSDDNNYKFPDGDTFNIPAFKNQTISIPGSNGIVKGFNFMAEWEIDTTGSKELECLQKFLQLKAKTAIILQVTPPDDINFYASCNATICGTTADMQFGAKLKDGKPSFYAKGDIKLSIHNTPLDVALEVGITPNGAFGSGTLKSQTDFVDFGFFKLGNLALQIGMDFEGVPSFGFAGSITSGEKFNSSIAVLFDSSDPKKSMVAGSVSDLSLYDVLKTFIKQSTDCESVIAMNQSIVDVEDVFKKFKISGTNTREWIISNELKEYLDNAEISKISDEFSKNGINIPSDAKNVFFSIGQKGKSWFITDLSDKMKHYEVFLNEDNKIRVSLEAQLYVAPDDTQIGEIKYQAGYFINALLEICNFHVLVYIEMNYDKGFSINEYMDPIEFGNGLVCISGVQNHQPLKDKGPHLHISSYESPFVRLNAYVSILKVTREYDCTITSDGFNIDFEFTNNLIEFKLKSILNGTKHFDATINWTAHLMPFKIIDAIGNIFGSFKYSSGINASVSFSISRENDKEDINFSCSFGVCILDIKKDFSFNLGVEIESIDALAKCVEDEIIKQVTEFVLKELENLDTYSKYIKNKLLEVEEDILRKTLNDVFHCKPEQIESFINEVKKFISVACPMENAVKHLN